MLRHPKYFKKAKFSPQVPRSPRGYSFSGRNISFLFDFFIFAEKSISWGTWGTGEIGQFECECFNLRDFSFEEELE